MGLLLEAAGMVDFGVEEECEGAHLVPTDAAREGTVAGFVAKAVGEGGVGLSRLRRRPFKSPVSGRPAVARFLWRASRFDSPSGLEDID